MNKIVSFLVVLVLWQTDVFAANADSIATSLHRAYRILNESPTEANQRTYFNAFPSTWRDFLRLEIQNDTITGSRVISADNIYVGRDVTEGKPYGDVILGQGQIKLKAKSVTIKDSTIIPLGTTFNIEN